MLICYNINFENHPPKKNVRTGIIIVLHNVLTGLLIKYCFRDCCMHIIYSCIPPTINNFLFFLKKISFITYYAPLSHLKLHRFPNISQSISP